MDPFVGFFVISMIILLQATIVALFVLVVGIICMFLYRLFTRRNLITGEKLN